MTSAKCNAVLRAESATNEMEDLSETSHCAVPSVHYPIILAPKILDHGPGSIILHSVSSSPLAGTEDGDWDLHARPSQDLHFFKELVRVARELGSQVP